MDYNEIAEEILENYTNTYCQANIERVAKVLKEISRQTAGKILEKGKYNMPEWLKDWIVEQFGVEIKE